METRTQSDETKLKIGAAVAQTRRIRPDDRSICVELFGKTFIELTPVERAKFKAYARAVSYYRRYEANMAKQREDKEEFKYKVLMQLGWPAKCQHCGYDDCIQALEFHHLNPTEKEANVLSLGLDRAVAEAKKCVLICVNCHRKAHAHIPRLLKKGGRPKAAYDPKLAQYMELSGFSTAMIEQAMQGRDK